ncbi:MAG: hypothetical protein EBS18_02715 [Actinobacteria bacterium]|nr:hypothetical protein [Actinomycetota bacterium]
MSASRSAVRNAIKDWIEAGFITDLNQVFVSFPKRINFQINSSSGQLSRAAGVVFIASESEERLAIGGAYNGWKRVDYEIDFQIFHHSLEPLAENAMESFDTVIDGVKDRLRLGGHTLGLADGSIIWQAAEPSITVQYGEPATDNGGATETWAAVHFTVTQMIQA